MKQMHMHSLHMAIYVHAFNLAIKQFYLKHLLVASLPYGAPGALQYK